METGTRSGGSDIQGLQRWGQIKVRWEVGVDSKAYSVLQKRREGAQSPFWGGPLLEAEGAGQTASK